MPDETPASQLVDLDIAQRALAAQLAELRGADSQHLHADMLAVGGAKLLQLSRLRDQLVSSANGMPPAALRAAVASAVADSRAYTLQARDAVSAVQVECSTQAATTGLNIASEAARSAATGFMDDYYKRRIFDPYLTFASAQDEEEFRRREAERQATIAKALAEHSPEGDLLASKLALDQLKDAGAHGADRSPDYKPTWDKLAARTHDLEVQLGQAPPEQPEPVSAKNTASTDPSAALQAAGVVLAREEDTPRVVPLQGASSQRGLA